MAIAHGGLGHLGDQGLRVAQQQVHDRSREIESRLDRRGLQPVADTGALDHGPVGGCFATHEKRDADDPFVANHGDLGRFTALRQVEQGNDGRAREIDMAQRTSRLVQDLAKVQVDQFKLVPPPLQLVVWKRREELV